MMSVGAFQWVLHGLHRSWSEGGTVPALEPGSLCRELVFPGGTEEDALPDVAPSRWGVTEDGGVKIDVRFGERKRELEIREKGDPFLPNTPSGPLCHIPSDEGVSISDQEERLGEEANSYMPPVPPLNICIMVVGTRGDVQPFIALGRGLKEYGHRIRIASHSVYRDFVLSSGLEFYPLGGDPKVMIETIVRNRGILTARIGEVAENRRQLRDIVFSTYDACVRPDPDGVKGDFLADAIIANPPSYGHIHCAERLGIPLHMVFTMPWTPTVEFVNPNARISDAVMSKVEYITGLLPKSRAFRWNAYVRKQLNWISFTAVEEIVSIGIKDIIDQFRVEALGLRALPNTAETRRLLDCRNVPFTYCWSPSLVDKPSDWGEHIDVVGFFFLNQTEVLEYEPPAELTRFLESGPPPVYIGFGSMVIEDPSILTRTIVEAMEETGLRAIVSRGWGGLGVDCKVPDCILTVGNVPHDWLFERCCAVVHHGGAGTTAAGLLAGCPTFVVPFFGDQPFWGESCYRAGVGPWPVSIDELDTKKLVAALGYMLFPRVRQRAKDVSISMRMENGVEEAIAAFHRHLPRDAVVQKRKIIWNLVEDGYDMETAPLLPEVLPPRKLGRLYWLWGWLGCPFRRRRKHIKSSSSSKLSCTTSASSSSLLSDEDMCVKQ